MDVSLGALRERLLEMRAWDSSGTTFDKRVRSALNVALDRLAGDVPEALVPDDEHIVLNKDTDSASHNLAINYSVDNRVLRITDTAGVNLGNASVDATAAAWYANTFKSDGTWDGIMHLEIKDAAGVWHRRQSREWWVDGEIVYVSVDRPWRNSENLMTFRIYQPEFFVSDDVMRILEPMRLYDNTRQQVWAIDTAGAYRQDMVDFQGESKGRPYRFYRSRHFQLQAPRRAALARFTSKWVGPWQQGKFSFVYTYVWGKKDEEWQQSPMGTNDPVWESAPSPISNEVDHDNLKTVGKAINIQMANIDQITNFGITGTVRRSHSGFRLRIYVARTEIKEFGGTATAYNNVEKAGVYYFLTEIDPDDVTSSDPDASFTWDGSIVPDYYRPLKHSTGYFAYRVYPHQDARYELDLRVLRLPKKFIDDQDTAPIQRDSIPALLELSLYYLCLQDGVDQNGAQLHLRRYEELARKYRLNYATPGRVVEPVPIGGHSGRSRYGVFSTSDT